MADLSTWTRDCSSENKITAYLYLSMPKAGPSHKSLNRPLSLLVSYKGAGRKLPFSSVRARKATVVLVEADARGIFSRPELVRACYSHLLYGRFCSFSVSMYRLLRTTAQDPNPILLLCGGDERSIVFTVYSNFEGPISLTLLGLLKKKI